MALDLTLVSLGTGPSGDISRLLFGVPREVRSIGTSRQIAVFEPDDVFGFERRSEPSRPSTEWIAGVVKCAAPGMEVCRVPGVQPGGILLLSAIGKHHARRALEAMEWVAEKRCMNAVPAAFWQRLSTQLQAGLPVACLLEREVW